MEQQERVRYIVLGKGIIYLSYTISRDLLHRVSF